MNMVKSMELIKKYSSCPECGSNNIGNGEGGLIVNENTFRRFCKCGYDITVNSDDKEVKTIKLSLEMSENDFKMIKEYIGCQYWDDTNQIIEKYQLKMNTDKVDSILEYIYKSIEKAI